jgi:hypothetical protein
MKLDVKKLPFGVRVSDEMVSAIELGAVIDAAIDENRRKVLLAMWDEMGRPMAERLTIAESTIRAAFLPEVADAILGQDAGVTTCAGFSRFLDYAAIVAAADARLDSADTPTVIAQEPQP